MGQIVQDMKDSGLDLTVVEDISDFLGVNITRHEDDTVHLTQPYLIDIILKELGFQGRNVKSKTIPAMSSKLLSVHKDCPNFDST